MGLVPVSVGAAAGRHLARGADQHRGLPERQSQRRQHHHPQHPGRRFFSDAFVRREGSASGTVLDKAGHVLTNFHVVEEARVVIVTLFDGSTHPAKLIGSDPTNDLAVLQIEAPAES